MEGKGNKCEAIEIMLEPGIEARRNLKVQARQVKTQPFWLKP
jgi:hypothetical protein